MLDRLTTARDTLRKAAATFRDYERHHTNRATNNPLQPASIATESMAKAARNREMAVECEQAAALLEAG